MARATANKRRTAPAAGGGRRTLILLAWLLGALALLAMLEPYLWVGGLVGELGFHLALVALGCACVAAWQRAYLPLAGLLASAAALGFPLLPLLRGSLPTPQKGPVLRLAAVHLGAALPRDAIQRFLARHQPDALALTGADTRALGPRVGTYRVVRSATSARAALLVQSLLFSAARDLSGWPSASVRVGRCHARVTALALPSRGRYAQREARAHTLAALTAAKAPPRSVWMGQLGSRAEANDLGAFVAHQALRDARIGHGRLATWPASLGPLGFPRTHVLVHGWISVRDIVTQPAIHADAQRTVTAELELTEPGCRFDPASGSE